MTDIFLILCFLLFIHYVWFIYTVYLGLSKIIYTENIISEFVSVIIPFRNEEDNILNCLNSIEGQNLDNDKYEIIFVDDSSTDASLKILKENISEDNVKVVSLENFQGKRGHKKAAIKCGLENSKGDIIVTTDADCTHEKDWLSTIIKSFDNNTAFVSGPVEFEDSNSLFGKMQKLEFAGLILTGAGLIGNKTPIICNGANLAFRKNVFYEVGGYDDLMNLSSGEDELLMQKIAACTKYDVKFCMNKNAVVRTNPMNTFKEFFNQRKRWASKGLFYKNKFLVLKLALIFLFYVSLISQLLFGVFYSSVFFYSFLFSYLFKILIEFIVLQKGARLLFNKNILRIFLLAEIAHVPYIIFSGLLGVIGNYKWKERELER